MDNLTGKPIYHYSYYFNDGSADMVAKNSYDINKVKVLLETDTEVVIGSAETVILQKGCEKRLSLNTPRVVIDIEDRFWGNSVIFDLYSTTELTSDIVKNAILKEIKNKVEFLGVTGLESITSRVNEVVKWNGC